MTDVGMGFTEPTFDYAVCLDMIGTVEEGMPDGEVLQIAWAVLDIRTGEITAQDKVSLEPTNHTRNIRGCLSLS